MPQRYAHFTPWNENTIRVLQEMWETGSSANEIAIKLNGYGYSITRNSVIGKAHRMNYKQPPRGLSPKALQNQPRKRIIIPASHPHASKWSSKKTKLPTKINTIKLDPNNPGIEIISLTRDTCRAIVREGSYNKLATYCGEFTNGKSYCPGHAAIYYQPAWERRR